jgi:ribose/xylose/arabinose/galactoside ABC-type transport system permease subunit
MSRTAAAPAQTGDPDTSQTPVTPPAAAGETPGRKSHGARTTLTSWRSELGVGSGLVILAIIWAFVAPNFLSGTNISLLFQQMSVLMVIAVGMAFVMLTGEIDLSVGSTVGLSTVVLAALTVQHGWPLVLAIVVCLATGAVIGLFTGLLRAIWNIPSFIITLGLLTALQGIAFLITNGVTIAPVPSALSPLWNGKLAGIPTPIWVMVVVVALGAWVLHRTRYGRHVYAVGGNPEASRRYGVKVNRIRVTNFVIVQMLAVLGGLLYAAELSSGNATIGQAPS